MELTQDNIGSQQEQKDVFHITDKEGSILCMTNTKAKQDLIMKSLLLKNHVESMLERCDAEIQKLYDGREDMPAGMNKNDPVWADICGERIEYLEGLRSKLAFILQYPERQQVV